MKIKTLLFTVVLAVLPGLALAGGCMGSQQVMSCPEGQMFDHDQGACVPVVTG